MKMKIGTTCHKTGFEKTVIATLLSVVFTQVPAFAQNIDISGIDGYPGKDSINSIEIKDSDNALINEYGVFKEVQYVAYVQGGERWVLYFRDPAWNTLMGLQTMKDWKWSEDPNDPNYHVVPEYKDRTVLTLDTKSSNVPEGTDEKDTINWRFSVFGAFYDGTNKDKLKIKDNTTGVDNILSKNDKVQIEAINEFFSKRSVVINLGNPESSYIYHLADIYGANNDFAGAVDDIWKENPAAKYPLFETNQNSVQISLGNNVLSFERIKGGKAPNWRDLTSTNEMKPLTTASNNVVYISSSQADEERFDSSGQPKPNLIAFKRDYTDAYNAGELSKSDIEFYLKPSIIGGDALQAHNNLVFLQNIVTKGIDRKFGIMGGGEPRMERLY